MEMYVELEQHSGDEDLYAWGISQTRLRLIDREITHFITVDADEDLGEFRIVVGEECVWSALRNNGTR